LRLACFFFGCLKTPVSSGAFLFFFSFFLGRGIARIPALHYQGYRTLFQTLYSVLFPSFSPWLTEMFPSHLCLSSFPSLTHASHSWKLNIFVNPWVFKHRFIKPFHHSGGYEHQPTPMYKDLKLDLKSVMEAAIHMEVKAREGRVDRSANLAFGESLCTHLSHSHVETSVRSMPISHVPLRLKDGPCDRNLIDASPQVRRDPVGSHLRGVQ
jgi:hypothetical protein